MTKKTKVWKILLIILLILLASAGGVIGYFFYTLSHDGVFIKRTTLNGYDVSEKTPEEVVAMMENDFKNITVSLTENGTVDLEGGVDDLGIQIYKEGALAVVQEAMDIQNGSLKDMAVSVMNGLEFHVDVPTVVDQDIFRSAVTVSALSIPRTASVDAQLVENEDGTYSVTDEVYGTEFADEDLQADLLVQISEALADVSGGQSAFNTGSISLTFPEGIYIKPSVYNNDPVLTRERDVYNSYCKAKITYQYGSETEVLDWSVIKDWVVINPDEAHIDRDLAWAYAQDIAMRYNTRYYERTFHTTTGRTVVFPSGQNEYGYTVNVDGEFGKLLDNISANEEVTREPVYYTKNDYDNPVFYKRNGRDDLAGNYVEVSISDQHLWMYKNGSVIVESDVVTGCVAKGHETACGVFPLAYKKSPDVLVGSNANDGYRTPVDYWMPFYEGQGLHDANWRGSFGGSIYQNSGSHGCVNLPPWAAKAIYENIEAGMAIIIYK